MKPFILALATLLLWQGAPAEIIVVRTADQLLAAVENAKPGDVIQVLEGRYALDQTVRLKFKATSEHPIRLEGAKGNRPVLDFSAQSFGKDARGLSISGDGWQISNLEISHAGDNGINLSGGNNVVSNCIVHHCQDTGIQISAGGNNNLIVDCDSYLNVDLPTKCENADGFAAKGKIGPGNVFRNCRAWENCDDGWDLWEAPESVRIENCVAFRNGINLWNVADFQGDGNGFKLGGNHIAGAHVVIGCTAIDQSLRGFNQNNNTGPLTLERCTAIRCNTGFYFPKAPAAGQHLLRHNLSQSPVKIDPAAVQENNRWLGEETSPTTRRSE